MNDTDTPFEAPYFAAVDLGSNSFHLLIARLNGDLLEKVDREKDMVQLASGLTEGGNLNDDVRTKALDCLQRFGERLRELPSAQVRAVGTKTLRDADAAGDFLKQAEEALGHPIAIISGYEEARLVYSGLSHSVVNDNNQRLVIDIGGASTEFVIGCDDQPELLESLDFGCVAITRRHFSQGITRDNIHAAYIDVCEKIEFLRASYVQHGWDIVYGTSGTMRAIATLTEEHDGGALISAEALEQQLQKLLTNGGIEGSDFSKQRRAVLPAGVVILKAIFDELGVNTLHVADATLKEGLIYDTIGRLSHDDTRTRSIGKLQRQYQVDTQQAERVSHMALHLWRQVDGPTLPGASRTKLLTWAAALHEIGLGISHSGHHHHGFYVLKHSDIAGFGRYEQSLLAFLVGCHRKKIIARLQELDDAAQRAMMPLLICLRLAIILNRGREGIDSHVNLQINTNATDANNSASPDTAIVQFSDGWLAEQPMTQAGLRQEAKYLKALGMTLHYD